LELKNNDITLYFSINNCLGATMKIKEIAISTNQLEALQSASKPLSPEQARVRAMKQNIDKQKEALAQERERQHDAKHAQKMQKLHQKSLGL
jgi:hypothetical protein